jgi:prepilin-type N-terminal cleavage/methylation domain-containing protein
MYVLPKAISMLKALPAKTQTLHTSQQGLSLLEVMIAIAVVVIAITALVTISNAAISSVNESRNQAISDQYARQTLEAVRVNRDQRGWNSFLTSAAATPQTMAIGEYRVFSLNGTIMTYKQNLSGSQITSQTYLCSIAQNSTYAVAGTTSFYRLVTVWLRDAQSAQITATLCYDYRANSNTNRKLEIQTLLTNWQ